MRFDPRSGRSPFRAALIAGAVASGFIPAQWAFAKLDAWRQETAAAFNKGHRERVVVSDNGRIRLGQSLSPVGKLDASRVWDLASTADGTVYAATGDAGKVFRRESKDGAEWTVAYDADDTQVLSLAVLPENRVLAGTGPTGLIVDLTDPKNPKPTPALDPSVKYIWDLATDAKGNLYAVTGPTGQLWKVAADGNRTLLYDSPHSHLLSVAVGSDGSVYAGSDGEGLIYRVSPDGKASVVYDAPQNEVRTLLFAPDGTLYAGTAAESGGGGGGSPGRGPGLFSGGGGATTSSTTPPSGATVASADAPEPPKPPSPTPPPRPPVSSPSSSGGGSASPKPPSPGDNAVYRISNDGVPREVFRARVLIYALAWQEGRLLVGTGPDGQLFEVRDQGHESAPIARLDHGQILALLTDPKGNLLIGTGDPGAVARLESGYVPTGTLVSEVLDTKLISRFGALSWRSDQPEATTVAVQVRSGNVGEPDATWSAWSPEQTTPTTSKANVPPGRFAQYRLTLSTKNQAVTPEVRSVVIRYQTVNLPPEVSKVDVPDVSILDGTTRQTKLTLRWDVSDPNGDELEYALHIRKDGWPDWIRLGDEHHTGSNYEWDTTSVPDGLYRYRLTASDRPSNNADDALTRERTSEPFLVDHLAPAVAIESKSRGAVVTLRDNATRITKSAYALDGGEWTPIFPDDGLYDSNEETITLSLPDLKPGTHVLVIRANDAAGNTGTGDILLDVR
ncbi:hypothetical protein [Singulisphaera sp. PoT]|uniref:hypothetical protein n=1 Tax=Singulisphaera sp. PoT TaxID=3411797 RepID=UPI003BF49580